MHEFADGDTANRTSSPICKGVAVAVVSAVGLLSRLDRVFALERLQDLDGDGPRELLVDLNPRRFAVVLDIEGGQGGRLWQRRLLRNESLAMAIGRTLTLFREKITLVY